jgi:hypothetical protein
MRLITRRTFLGRAATAAAAATFTARSWAQVAGANSDIRLAIAGMNGRGKELSAQFPQIPGSGSSRSAIATPRARPRDCGREARGNACDRCVDYRELLARKDIDAIAIATPNHQHAMQSIWAMQAGKDVLHEKPVTHNLWEGAQGPRGREKAPAHRAGEHAKPIERRDRRGARWLKAEISGKVTAVRGSST